MKKELTVVIPSYNQGEFIGVNLGVLSMFKDELDVIVVDNMSDDSTRCVLEKYRSICWCIIEEKDDGQADAINKGIMLARTKWVAFQNSDDYYTASGLRAALDVMSSYSGPPIDMILGATSFVDRNGLLLKKGKTRSVPYLFQAVSNHLNNQSVFFTKDSWASVGGFNVRLRFCMDYEFLTKVLRRSVGRYYLRREVGCQRLYDETKTFLMKDVHDSEFNIVNKELFLPWERLVAFLLYPLYKSYRFFSAYGKNK